MKLYIVHIRDIGFIPKLSYQFSGVLGDCQALAVIDTEPTDTLRSLRNELDEWKAHAQMPDVAIVDGNGEFITR